MMGMIAIRAEATSTITWNRAALEERARIARELHDGLLQDAMTIALHLRAVLPDVRAASESAARALLPIVELAEQTTAEARRDIMGMRAIAPDERLVDALERTIRRASARTRLMTSTMVFGRVRPLPAPVQDAVVRIVREAATNVVRHARARTIRLTVAFANRRLRVTIDDDGQGFEATRIDATTDHFGVIGMHERASAVHGSIDVRSRVGLGTTVALNVPLHFGPSNE
jgi:signal transduction histidine kinase